MTHWRQLRQRRFGPLAPALAAALLIVLTPSASPAAPAASADTRETPPPRTPPAATRAPSPPSGGSQPRVAVPRDSGNPSQPSTRHQPRSPEGSGGGRGRGSGYHPSRYGYGYGYGYNYYWPWARFYGPYWGYPHYPWGLAWYPAYSGEVRLGSLDLNVKPKKADVYVDGEYVGRAAKFDGWPSHLWLETGRHELVFHYDGYETLVRSVDVQRGPVRRLRIDMRKGEARPVEEVLAERRRPRVAETESRAPKPRVEPAGAAAERDPGAGSRAAAVDLRGEPGRFSLEVVPADASVYLDGRFLGSAEELARLHAGMMVDPGDHLLEVQRPGYETKRIEFSVGAGDQRDLSIDLESIASGG